MPTFKEDLHMGNRLPVVLCGCCCGGNGGSGGGGGSDGGGGGVADGSITTNKLADGAVTTSKIADGAVTSKKLANGSVTADKMSSGVMSDIAQEVSEIIGQSPGSGESDKPYNPGNFSGLGKVYLKKNIIDGKNYLVQDMFYKDENGMRVPNTNTIFVLRYDYTLGENIVIPDGCILEFDGGSVKSENELFIQSVDTKVTGTFQDSRDIFQGALYDGDGELVHFNAFSVGSLKSTTIYGNTLSDVLVKDGAEYDEAPQSCVATEENIFVIWNRRETPGEDSSTGAIWVYDRYFNLLGRTEVEGVGHGNGATICNNTIYIAGGDTVVRWVGIDAVMNHYGGTVSCNTKSFNTLGYNINGIDYDPVSNKIAIDQGGYILLCDTSLNLLSTSSSSNRDGFNRYKIEMNRTVVQDIIYRNGLVYYFYYASNYEDLRGSMICIVYDSVCNKFVQEYHIDGNYSDMEIEGVCVDPKTGMVFGTCMAHNGVAGVWCINAYSFTEEEKRLIDNEYLIAYRINGNLDYYYTNTQSIGVYVDNTFGGISLGTLTHPYKSLGEAIAMTRGVDVLEIRLAQTDEPYRGNIICGEKSLVLKGNGQTMYGVVRSSYSSVTISDVKFIANTNEMTVRGASYGSAIYSKGSTLTLSNVTIETPSGFSGTYYGVVVDSSKIIIYNKFEFTSNGGNAIAFRPYEHSVLTFEGASTVKTNALLIKADSKWSAGLYVYLPWTMLDFTGNGSLTNATRRMNTDVDLGEVRNAEELTSFFEFIQDNDIMGHVFITSGFYSGDLFYPQGTYYVDAGGTLRRQGEMEKISDVLSSGGRISSLPQLSASTPVNHTQEFVDRTFYRRLMADTVSYKWRDALGRDIENDYLPDGENLIVGSSTPILTGQVLGPEKRVWRTTDTSRNAPPSIIPVSNTYLPAIKMGFSFDTERMEDVAYDIVLSRDGIYCLSCWVKGTGTLKLQAGGDSYISSNFEIASSDKFVYKKFVFVVTEGLIRSSQGFSSVYVGANGALTVCGIKLERGYGSSLWKTPTNYGISLMRPTIAEIGEMYFDTTLEKPIYYAGNGNWVDATGTKVAEGDTGLKIAIIGDSISSFSGTSPTGYQSYYPAGDVLGKGQVWWMQVCASLGANYMNCSWSGGGVTGAPKGATAVAACSDVRVEDVATKWTPDVILCFIGTDEWVNDVSMGTWDSGDPVVDDSAYTSTNTVSTFREAYALMLSKLKTEYPSSLIAVCTLPAAGTAAGNGNSVTMADFNLAIKRVAAGMDLPIIESDKCGITYDNLATYTSDNIHPNVAGHTMIAEYVIGMVRLYL